ncbi:MAG: hypothetical protein AB7S26_11415 [Sandaracinaceae bacterium]
MEYLTRGIGIVIVGFGLALVGCGGPSEPEAEPQDDTSAGDEQPSVNGARLAVPRTTGTWIVNGQPFEPEVAFAYQDDDGAWQVRLAAPAIDCAFAREGGVPPDDLRQIRIHVPSWEPGATAASSSGDMVGQVVMAYDGESSLYPGQVMPMNTIVNGNTTATTAAPTAETVGTLTVAAADDERTNVAEGEVDVRLCE